MILTMMMMIQKIYRSHKLIVMAIGVLMGLKVAMTPMLMRLVTGNGDSDDRKRTTAQG